MGASQRGPPRDPWYTPWLHPLNLKDPAVSEHPETVDRNEVDDLSVERALRVGLDEFELEDEDVSLLEREGEDDVDAEESGPVPVVAIIGRPNVGKSTLVNRILGRREAVVQDVPGVTRDRISYEALWTGRRFMVQDTGGWEPDAKGLQGLVAEQAAVAMRTADAIILVVDALVGATTADEAAARILLRSGKPVFLAANKVDSERAEADAATLWSLGLGEPHAVSAMHGRGVAELLDVVLAALPQVAELRPTSGGPRRVA